MPYPAMNAHRFRKHVDIAQRRKFIEQQQHLAIEFGVLFRQFAGIEIDHLLKKQIQKRRHAVEIVRRYAEIDRHRPLPQLPQIEIIGRGGGIDARVEPETEPRRDGLAHRVHGVFGGSEEIVQAP